MTKILITGATSFIGSKFLSRLLKTDYEICSLERLPRRHEEVGRLKIFYHDLRAEVPEHVVKGARGADVLVHLAADVSGIKSLADPRLSVETNVVGTFNTLELARKLNLRRFIYVSTGEVVGSAPFPFFLDERAPLRPSNPYAAAKAAAEALVNAYRVSFGVPALVVRSMNVFGPGQQLTRFVPMVSDALCKKQRIKCHVGRDGTVGSRCWLHVDKLVGALMRAVDPRHNYHVGEIYHVVGPERTNEEIIRSLAGALNLDFQLEKVVPGPSHDLRYALKDTKLDYQFEDDFEDTLAATARSFR